MKIAIMQPYFFPYIGYFQLINAVNKFIFYDDVNFIKHGWINRNRILVSGREYLFSIPIQNISQNKKICETQISTEFIRWYKKFRKTIDVAYSKAPNYNVIVKIIDNVLDLNSKSISNVAINSVIKICEFLNIDVVYELSSEKYSQNCEMGKAERLIDICKKNDACVYINLGGGKEIYTKDEFAAEEIELKFLTTNEFKYKQFENSFVSNLSIIDVMMFNSPDEIKQMLNNYSLL